MWAWACKPLYDCDYYLCCVIALNTTDYSYTSLGQLHLNLSCGFQSLETKFLKLFRCFDFLYPIKHLFDYLSALISLQVEYCHNAKKKEMV